MVMVHCCCDFGLFCFVCLLIFEEKHIGIVVLLNVVVVINITLLVEKHTVNTFICF